MMPAARTQTSPPAVRVEVTTAKKVFPHGEPITFRALLTNVGSSAVYVSKSFGPAGGGYAGFYVIVEQITGRPAKEGCGSAADRGMELDSRGPEQILREEYFPLQPSEFVGYEGRYAGCVAQYPGKYRITVEYSAQDFYQSKVKDLQIGPASVLDGVYRSQPAVFMIR